VAGPRGTVLRALLAGAALCGAAACDRAPAPPPREAAGVLPTPVQARVDSGNAAYAAGAYEAALRHYREAVRLGPEHAAAWYGVQMAASALGLRPLADSAAERVQALSPSAPPGVHHPDAVPRRPPRSTAT
jgi:tetratricopeptide (TPR) repeat protein